MHQITGYTIRDLCLNFLEMLTSLNKIIASHNTLEGAFEVHVCMWSISLVTSFIFGGFPYYILINWYCSLINNTHLKSCFATNIHNYYQRAYLVWDGVQNIRISKIISIKLMMVSIFRGFFWGALSEINSVIEWIRKINAFSLFNHLVFKYTTFWFKESKYTQKSSFATITIKYNCK